MHDNMQDILTLLQDFKGIESLKELFWQELNYNRDNTPIPNLPEGFASLVAEDPISIATAGNNNDFHVIYTRLNTETPRKTHQRKIISHLQTRYPDALYVFSNTDQDRWHFVNVKLTREDKKEGEKQTQGRTKQRNIFRRITVAPEERLRTAAERIALLDIEEIGDPDSLFDVQDLLTPIEIRKGHEEAFNVEAVTAAFFENYKSIFKLLQTELKTQNDDEKWAHDFAQQFLTRCIFLYFVQKKRWLGNDPDFLHTFWKTYQSTSQPADTFVKEWLNILFFKAFNNRFHGGLTYFPAEIRETLQLAPYLNGGLFRENELDTEYPFQISDKLWEQIFSFLEQYNFTIAEDTPLDQEVAVDPEMIGKVYESLVSVEDEERGDAGIFYTPRIEIDLMCRLAIVDNLANHIGNKEDKHLFYEALFAFDPDEKAEADAKLTHLWEEMHDHLSEITVVDPACGSGSFLVGMLHILDDLHERAEKYLNINVESRFERRKQIIGKNLYGVDVKEWACKVAELRLWLALIIDADFKTEDLNIRKEPLLPDFSLNIRHGDSIVQDIGGMNLTQTRAIGSGVPPSLKGKITKHQNEKLKFYNNEKERKYKQKEDAETAENNIFREILEHYETQIDKNIRKVKAWLEDPTEQLSLLDPPQESYQENSKTVRMQRELTRHEENLTQVQRTRKALSLNTKSPFVWDIAFVEIFHQRGGFDIVIENPPYIRQEDIRDLMLPKDEGIKTANKKAYKAKLARSVYQVHKKFFNYRREKDIKLDDPGKAVKHKLSGRSDLYIYFYFHGLSLLNSRGAFCSITSKSWLDAEYGKDLQEFLLKQCHLKLVLDNAVQRSFETADVNTVICLISAPGRMPQSCVHNKVRFVNFKVPFEVILDDIIFFEIESAGRHVITPEDRIHTLIQKQLIADGLNKNNKYIGDKWAGKYLRSPDIFWHLLEKGKEKLVRVDRIADIRRGFTTGSNSFFLINDDTISTWQLEDEFLSPVINSPKEMSCLLVRPEKLPYKLFLCPKEKFALSGTAALNYIEWGEYQGIHRKSTCKQRQRWYDLGKRVIPSLHFQRVINTTVRTVYTPDGCYSMDNFAELHLSEDLRHLMCLILNSTFFQLVVNVNGRSNLGGGALTVQIYELENLLCVNPNLLLGIDINQDVLTSSKWDVLNPSPERLYIDNIIFDILELTQGERDGVYEAVTKLVTTRLEKAKT